MKTIRVLILLMLTAAIFAAGFFLLHREEKGYTRIQFHASCFHDKLADTTTVVWEDRVMGVFAGKLQWTYSAAGNSYAFITAEQVLYYLCDGKMVRVADGAESVLLSDDGLSLEYTAASGERFCAKQLLSDDGPAISGAKEKVRRLWNEWDNEEKTRFGLYGMIKGEAVRIADNLYPLTFDRYLYGYRRVEIEKEPYWLNDLYCISADRKARLAVTGIDDWRFSRDGGQMLYSDLENTYLYLAGSGESRLLCQGRNVALLEPSLAVHREYEDFCNVLFTVDLYTPGSYSIRSDLYYLDEALQAHLLAEGVNYEKLSLDGKTVWYWIMGEGVYRHSLENPDDRTRIIDGDVDWSVTDDGEYWYWSDGESVLWGSDGNETRRLADNVLFFSHSGITADNRFMFDADGCLYICRGIENPVLLAENVSRFQWHYLCPQYTVCDAKSDPEIAFYHTYALRADGTESYLYTVERKNH